MHPDGCKHANCRVGKAGNGERKKKVKHICQAAAEINTELCVCLFLSRLRVEIFRSSLSEVL